MKISPSILNADFLNLKKEIKSINNCDYIHLDIMDGNFVPNISFGPDICKQVRKETDIFFDTHLMVNEPLKWIEKFNIKNTRFITVHFESKGYSEALNKINELGIKKGLSIKPKTKVSEIKNLLKDLDLVLVMSVEPGFGGQKFMVQSLDKIKELKKLREKYNYKYLIEVDGGINNETIKLVKEAGADMVVVGSYLFKQKNRKKLIKLLRSN